MIRQNNVYKETIDFQIYLEKKIDDYVIYRTAMKTYLYDPFEDFESVCGFTQDYFTGFNVCKYIPDTGK